jgi:hypothetical protein
MTNINSVLLFLSKASTQDDKHQFCAIFLSKASMCFDPQSIVNPWLEEKQHQEAASLTPRFC